jgi:long-chain acyl-CoA synthetase
MIHEKLEFTNVRHLVEWAGETHGERPAYSFRVKPHSDDITRISYAVVRDNIRALASELLAMGCAGKHCVLIGKMSYEWALTYFAVMSIGGVLVPLDRDWSAEELTDTARFADAAFLLCDSDIADKGAYIASQISLEHAPIYLGGKGEDSLTACISAGREKFAAAPEKYFDAPINPMALALLVFTSGTTGKGKGVMLNQNALLADMYDAIPYIDFGSRTVSVLPPHHTYGSTIMCIGHTIIGCEVYISSGIRYVQKELREQKPEHLILVPLYLETFYRKILSNIKEQGKEQTVARGIKLSRALLRVGIDRRAQLFAAIRTAFGGEVRTIICGGAPINPEILHFFEDIGISVLNGYGITECAPIISFNRSRNVVDGSVGNVLDMDTVRIDEPNEDGEGEILVKGPNVMLGYYKNEQATAEAFKEGYFRTGDYGKKDKNGILYITGRKKNLIILSNGKNVYPEEIENELTAIPGILDIIVYEGQSARGISHNAIVAEIYPDYEYFEKNGIEDIKEYFKPFIDDYNKKAIAYKKIAVLKVRKTEFPKNTLRKIMRFKLDTTID